MTVKMFIFLNITQNYLHDINDIKSMMFSYFCMRMISIEISIFNYGQKKIKQLTSRYIIIQDLSVLTKWWLSK